MSDTVGTRLVNERRRLDIKQIDLSNLLKITPVTMRKYEQNLTSIPSDKLEVLHYHNFDIGYIITGKIRDVAGKKEKNNNKNKNKDDSFRDAADFLTDTGSSAKQNDYAWIPLYDVEVSAGNGRFFDSENIITHLSFTKYSLNKRGLSADKLGFVIVHGDSMQPTLQPNDCILVDFGKRNPDGGVFVIRVGDMLHVKRLITEKDNIKVISDNSIYDSWTLNKTDDFEIIGKFCWVGRYVV